MDGQKEKLVKEEVIEISSEEDEADGEESESTEEEPTSPQVLIQFQFPYSYQLFIDIFSLF